MGRDLPAVAPNYLIHDVEPQPQPSTRCTRLGVQSLFEWIKQHGNQVAAYQWASIVDLEDNVLTMRVKDHSDGCALLTVLQSIVDQVCHDLHQAVRVPFALDCILFRCHELNLARRIGQPNVIENLFEEREQVDVLSRHPKLAGDSDVRDIEQVMDDSIGPLRTSERALKGLHFLRIIDLSQER